MTPSLIPDLHAGLNLIDASFGIRITSFDGNTPLKSILCPPEERIEADGVCFALNHVTEPFNGGWRLRAQLTVQSGNLESANLSLAISLGTWSPDAYVLFPAAAYAGNRFQRAAGHFPEHVSNPSKDMPIIIYERMEGLNPADGPSRMDFRSGDLSTPGVAVQIPALKKGLILLTKQATERGNTGLSLLENDDRTAAEILISAPCVRPGERHRKRGDRGQAFGPGDSVEFLVHFHVVDAPDINALFAEFFEHRNELRVERPHHEIPFSSCWATQEHKYNDQNWVEEFGYYSVGMREVPSQDWQSSWVGGMNTVYPLLCEGSELTRQRALRTFEWLISGQTEAGYYNSGAYQGEWGPNRCTLQRYNADILFFMLKEFRLLESKFAYTIPDHWKTSLHKQASAFCALWEKEGQIGHRVDLITNEIIWGNTASGAILPAGLALAAGYYDEPRFLQIARDLAEFYYRNYVSRGIINGGPGDHLQAPDSEATAGMLESFTTLYEETGEAHWLDYAKDAAHQAASWTMTYDFVFPPESTFGKLDMRTVGTVFANIQNQHSAPGICSLSGNALLKLFRATGNARYLDLLREIAHAIPQFMSRADRPITDRRPGQRWPVMPPGWINERVNTSDWEVRGDPDNEIGVGEIFGGSTWAEVAMMLTYAELPGIYVQPDTGLVSVFDHVDAKLEFDADKRPTLRITNPTQFHASVKIFSETSEQARTTLLGPVSMESAARAEVPPGATTLFTIPEKSDSSCRIPIN